MSRFEKKFGKYAIKNLSLILIICYAVGYLLQLVAPNFVSYLQLDPYRIINNFQVWRIFTWLLIPPDTFSFFTLIMLYFYYSLGTSLEMVWGTYRYNVYLLSGFLFTVLGAFGIYFFSFLLGNEFAWASMVATIPLYVSTYYVNMSIFLAYAATFPDSKVYIFFVLPVKVKILGIIYAAILVYEFISYAMHGAYVLCVVIVVSLLNFILFFFTQRKKLHFTPGNFNERRYEFKKAEGEVKHKVREHQNEKKDNSITRHKCAICGRTDVSNPELSFRFCSKCNGNYEYCEMHLFTHKHID